MSSTQHVSEAGAATAGAAGAGGWRALVVLELLTGLVLVATLLLHALRTRLAGARAGGALRGRTVLIAQGDTELGEALCSEFQARGCHVTAVVKEAPSEVGSGGGVHRIHCDVHRRDQVCSLAEQLSDIDILVICGADNTDGLDGIAKTVTEELYANFHMLEQVAGRMRAGGRAAWVCGAAGRGRYAGAARALHSLARTLLAGVASRCGVSAVWVEARSRQESPRELAARTARAAAADSLPTSADVFRELRYRVRAFFYETFSRFCKLWA